MGTDAPRAIGRMPSPSPSARSSPSPASWRRRRMSAWLRSRPATSTASTATTTARTTTATVTTGPPRPCGSRRRGRAGPRAACARPGWRRPPAAGPAMRPRGVRGPRPPAPRHRGRRCGDRQHRVDDAVQPGQRYAFLTEAPAAGRGTAAFPRDEDGEADVEQRRAQPGPPADREPGQGGDHLDQAEGPGGPRPARQAGQDERATGRRGAGDLRDAGEQQQAGTDPGTSDGEGHSARPRRRRFPRG